MTRTLAFVLVLAGCYSPSVERCTIVCSGPTDTCPLDMTCQSDLHCHAADDPAVDCPQVHTVDVMITGVGNGSGVVTSNGINCPSLCKASVNHGTMMTFTQSTNADSRFTMWGGDCPAAMDPCTLAITKDTTVFANYVHLETLTVDLNFNGGQGGVSTSDGSLMDCNQSPCQATFDHGTQVTITAGPYDPAVFAGWTGACSGTGSCVVTMNGPIQVTAEFN